MPHSLLAVAHWVLLYFPVVCNAIGVKLEFILMLFYFIIQDQDENATVESAAYVVAADSSCTVVVEGVTVCSTASACDAMLLLFMAHYIFNLEYSSNKLFFRFIQEYLVGLNSLDSKMPAKLRSFIEKINTA